MNAGDILIPRPAADYLLVLACAALACMLPAASLPATPAAVSVPELTLEQLRNVNYQLGGRDDHGVVQLVDGRYKHGVDATTLDFAYVAVTDFISVGDLTADGVKEAAVIFLENYGGTGNFGFLAIYSNVNGLPVFLTSTLIDDRPQVNAVAIENGEVFLDAVVHGADDGGCCPQLPTTRRYALVNNQLRLMNYTTRTPGGTNRSIAITAPAAGALVGGSLQVRGDLSVAPLENNLPYFIYDESGNQISSGPTMVAAPDLGAPGTFSATISLAGIPPGGIFLEIQDLSVTDGSLLAMDAVKLSVK